MTEHDDEHTVTHDEASEIIADGLERGVQRSKIRLNDRRMTVLFLFLIAIGAFFLTRTTEQQTQIKHSQVKIEQQQVALQKAQEAAKANCTQTNTTNAKFNAVVDQLAANAKNSTGINAAQKQQALAIYASLHLAITDCSHLAGS